ncbi:MAG: aminofutalosine synthase MqnE [Verrucomicrobia bacterium]|nr:MAG: aminofutalosine synthase MqnE [Verrucomicrobiota bacterium]
MNILLRDPFWRELEARIEAGERLDAATGERLLACRDLHGLAALANRVTERLNGRRATYIVNRYINYSNYCILSCQFCAFARKKRDGDGFELTIEEMVAKAREAVRLGVTELHIVGGLHPSLPYDWYRDLLRALRAVDARLRLKCFTAIEIRHLARIGRRPIRQVLEELRECGLDCLTGGGAEIFNPAVRDRIARGKETAEEWLEVHRTWHQMGGRSTCTMLFGHVETMADRVDHLLRLRALQDETGGFVGFIPLPYQPENNRVPVDHPPGGWDILRTIAVSRLLLDNVRHITAYWVGMGLKLAQVALSHGADDLHGTIQEEHIFRMAGGRAPQLQSREAMIRAIREAGKTPVQRDTFYEPVAEEPGSDGEAQTAVVGGRGTAGAEA